MQIDILPDAGAVAAKGAEFIAFAAQAAVAERGRFVFAVSGGHTPWLMLRHLAEQDIPWERIEIVQVDERVAPAGDPERNLTHVQESLLGRTPLSPAQVHAMPVEQGDLAAAAADYARMLQMLSGSPAELDLVHLGLGPDGHTASLVPGDPVLEVADVDIAVTGPYQDHRRMTLTYPILNRARRILWVVTGAEKAPVLPRLRHGDPEIPAGRVRQDQAMLLADEAAAEHLTGAP